VKGAEEFAGAFAILAAIALTMALIGPVSAHKSSDSYLNLRVNRNEIVGQWDAALRDLDYALGLDSDNDGIITWRELRARHALIAENMLSHLSLRTDGKACPARVIDHLVDDHSDGAYEVLRFTAKCDVPVRALDISYTFFFDLDPQHRGLLRLQTDGGTFTTVFSPSQKSYHLEGKSPNWAQEFVDYFKEGIWHIWSGFDHILFLCALLLPSVLSFHSGKWWALRTFGEAFRNVFKIVTAFTVAHSITLSLAVLGFIEIPSRLVESAIAISVIAAALNNLWPIVQGRLWVVAFGFGLVHGLGFANVLTELGLPAEALVVALVGFNLGVEAGQLVIVCAVLPLAYCCRRSWLYPGLMLRAGSVTIVAIAFVWLIERTFNLNIFS
jgi:HupE / UreJ protein